MTVCSYHVMYAFQSESTLCSCLNVKELLARRRRKIWSLSDCHWTRTHNHLVHKRKLNHLAKLGVRLWTKWLWVQVQLHSLDLAVSKLVWGIGWTFIKAPKNLKLCTFMSSFCPKHNVLAWKCQRNYASWHWNLMKNLSENWLLA